MAYHPATIAQNGSKCHCAPLRSPLSAMRWPSEPNGLTASIASSSSSSLKKEQGDRISFSAMCFRFLVSCDHAQDYQKYSNKATKQNKTKSKRSGLTLKFHGDKRQKSIQKTLIPLAHTHTCSHLILVFSFAYKY